jgi:hypothetical protein
MRHIGTDFRNRLSPRMFEAVQILKGGYKAGVISARAEIQSLDAASFVDDDTLFDAQTTFSSNVTAA